MLANSIRRCLVCRRTEVDKAHIKTRGSGGSNDPSNIIDLCREHHTEQHKIGIVTFVKKYSSVKNHLLRNGWYIQTLFGRERLVRAESGVS